MDVISCFPWMLAQQNNGYSGSRTSVAELYAGCSKVLYFHISEPVVCEMPVTPEFVRCELYEVIGFPREQLTKGSELSLRESIEK